MAAQLHCQIIHIHTLGKFSLASPPTSIFLEGGRKLENPKETPQRHRVNMQNSAQAVTQAQDRTEDPGAVRQQHHPLHRHDAHLQTSVS